VVISSFNLPLSSERIFILASEKPKENFDQQNLDSFSLYSVKKIGRKFAGTGDILTACLLAWSWKHPDNFQLAVKKAIASLQAVILLTDRCRSRELKLIQSKDFIVKPPLFTVVQENLKEYLSK